MQTSRPLPADEHSLHLLSPREQILKENTREQKLQCAKYKLTPVGNEPRLSHGMEHRNCGGHGVPRAWDSQEGRVQQVQRRRGLEALWWTEAQYQAPQATPTRARRGPPAAWPTRASSILTCPLLVTVVFSNMK